MCSTVTARLLSPSMLPSMMHPSHIIAPKPHQLLPITQPVQVLILINQFFTAPVTVLSDTIVMSSAKQVSRSRAAVLVCAAAFFHPNYTPIDPKPSTRNSQDVHLGPALFNLRAAAPLPAHPTFHFQDGDYGKVRAWGAVGWGGFSAVSGTIIDKWGYLAGFITRCVFAVRLCVFLQPTRLLAQFPCTTWAVVPQHQAPAWKQFTTQSPH